MAQIEIPLYHGELEKMGQFIWALMWNDMHNQKVAFESFLILDQNMFLVQVLDFKLIYVYEI
jgi:hypothetical protein